MTTWTEAMDLCARCDHPRWLHDCTAGPHLSHSTPERLLDGMPRHPEHRDPDLCGVGWCEMPVKFETSETGYCQCPRFVEREKAMGKIPGENGFYWFRFDSAGEWEVVYVSHDSNGAVIQMTGTERLVDDTSAARGTWGPKLEPPREAPAITTWQPGIVRATVRDVRIDPRTSSATFELQGDDDRFYTVSLPVGRHPPRT
jgi:hypothetical protein